MSLKKKSVIVKILVFSYSFFFKSYQKENCSEDSNTDFLLVMSAQAVTSLFMLLYASLTLNHLNRRFLCGTQKQSRAIIRVKAVMLACREAG